MLLLSKQQQYKIYKTNHIWLQCRPTPPRSSWAGGGYTRLKKKTTKRAEESLADVNIPVPVRSLVPPPGHPFPILVTVAILGFVAAPLSGALVVVLVRVPGAVPRLPVSVLPAPVGLLAVAVLAGRGAVVRLLVRVLFLGLHVGGVATLLRLRVQGLLPGEASAGAAAMVVVLGGGAMLGFLDRFRAGFFFSLRSRAGRSPAICPLIPLRTLEPGDQIQNPCHKGRYF